MVALCSNCCSLNFRLLFCQRIYCFGSAPCPLSLSLSLSFPSSSFKQFLELDPQLRDVITQFHQSRYASCLRTLDDMRSSLMLDMYLSQHLHSLLAMIRNKALIQVSAAPQRGRGGGGGGEGRGGGGGGGGRGRGGGGGGGGRGRGGGVGGGGGRGGGGGGGGRGRGGGGGGGGGGRGVFNFFQTLVKAQIVLSSFLV